MRLVASAASVVRSSSVHATRDTTLAGLHDVGGTRRAAAASAAMRASSSAPSPAAAHPSPFEIPKKGE